MFKTLDPTVYVYLVLRVAGTTVVVIFGQGLGKVDKPVGVTSVILEDGKVAIKPVVVRLVNVMSGSPPRVK